MLPELFKVGNTMQEDYGFFNTSSLLNDKVVTSSGSTSAPVFIDFDSSSHSPSKEAEIVVSESNNSSPEINKWPFNYGINFLKTSDDPMISSVHQESGCNENELLKRNSCNTESSSSPKPSFEITSSEDVSYSPDVSIKPSKRLNLQFHNQLFPQENYNNFDLNQYQSSQEKGQKILLRAKRDPAQDSIDESQMKEEGVITWLQKMMLKTRHVENKKKSETKCNNLKIATKEETFYKNENPSLPYMGQMTLENMKPRRGRKPKKADICHLIYKNYGTIVPKSSHPNVTSAAIIKPSAKPASCTTGKIQIETKNKSNKETKLLQTEPLNLCVREKLKRNATLKDNHFNLVFAAEVNEKKTATKDKILTIPSSMLSSNDGKNEIIDKLDTTTISSQQSSSFDSVHPDSFADYIDFVSAEQCSNAEPSSTTANSFCQHQKRKRSAIFIPPVQTECSTSNPTNEVSICKFKFTGGTKPSLQEKKILSVDAGGNFRYFSGTGDKSMRGYEFFPRENLLKSSMSAQSHTNAFLNAASQKLPLDSLPPISPDINNKLLNLSDVDSTGILDKNFADASETSSNGDKIEEYPDLVTTSNRRRPVVNRTVQRRKLEKTFKEKGFLIQTQQLQSAEGATYCKFRQLRKFTRYLFRSWKDYLPPCEAKPEN